ncbi:hypothetical protein HanIR_Chr13g0632161 [Helianthus annuus]|nr:hypothetical protein HanIR_Chr13g0632161 [Helianthus annuus]
MCWQSLVVPAILTTNSAITISSTSISKIIFAKYVTCLLHYCNIIMLAIYRRVLIWWTFRSLTQLVRICSCYF